MGNRGTSGSRVNKEAGRRNGMENYEPVPMGNLGSSWVRVNNEAGRRNGMEKYEIGRQLGRGSFGVTYEVCNRETGDLLAMKCLLRAEIMYDKILGEYVEREIMNHRVLQHEHVIRFQEVVLDDYKLGIVMEHGGQGHIFDGLLSGNYSETKARKIFQQLIAGLSYIHSKRTCHRDLKPENLLLNSDGDLKICDFGSSKSSEIQSKAKTIIGTEFYFAPEVRLLKSSVDQSGQSYDGKRADMWACGLILFKMLTGIYPQEDKPLQCIDSLPVSEECKDIFHRLFVADPNNRITTEQIMEHRWYKMALDPKLTAKAQEALRKDQIVIPNQAEEDIKKILAQIKKPLPVLDTVEETAETSTNADENGQISAMVEI